MLPPTGKPLGTDAGMVWLRSIADGEVSAFRKANRVATSASVRAGQGWAKEVALRAAVCTAVSPESSANINGVS